MLAQLLVLRCEPGTRTSVKKEECAVIVEAEIELRERSLLCPISHHSLQFSSESDALGPTRGELLRPFGLGIH